MEVPRKDAPRTVYRRYLQAGVLGFQRCGSCGEAVYRRSGGPYNVTLVDLEEGFRMMSRVDDLTPEAIEAGMPVRFEVRRDEDGEPVAVFVPGER